MRAKTLLIDTSKELSIKYKKILEDDENEINIIKNIPLAIKFIQENEPDLIIISDRINENLSDFCSKLRLLTCNMRPVIICLSKSSEIQDKISILEGGADDFISEPINNAEFKIRIKAHLRREFENNLDIKTKLPTKKYCLKSLKRIIAGENEWGCLLATINHLDTYKENYTEIASNKLIQTYSAIINSSLDETDFLGLLTENEFLIITSKVKIEKIASFLIFAFDTVKEKFYTEEDSKRGYIIERSNDYSGRKHDFVTTTIAGVTNDIKIFGSIEEILHSLNETLKLVGISNKSNYLIQRQQLSGENSVIEKTYNNKVLIIEKDEALSLLISTNLSLKGFKVKYLNEIDNINNYNPALVIIDSGEDIFLSNLNICKKIKSENKLIKIIATSIFHDQENILNKGADIYLPKPYDVDSLLQWVDVAIKEYNT